MAPCWWECKVGQLLWKPTWWLLKKTKPRITATWSSDSALGCLLERIESRDLNRNIYINGSKQHYSQQPKGRNSLSIIDKWVKKMWCIYICVCVYNIYRERQRADSYPVGPGSQIPRHRRQGAKGAISFSFRGAIGEDAVAPGSGSGAERLRCASCVLAGPSAGNFATGG